MTRDAVQRAVATAVRTSFRMARVKTASCGGEAESLAAALQYADQLVMPLIDLAIEQALEEGSIASLRAAADPEPADDPDLPG